MLLLELHIITYRIQKFKFVTASSFKHWLYPVPPDGLKFPAHLPPLVSKIQPTTTVGSNVYLIS